MKMSTALKRARADKRRAYDEELYGECPLCTEGKKRQPYTTNEDGTTLTEACDACPACTPVIRAMGWHCPGDWVPCLSLAWADAEGDSLARRITGELLLNLEAQGD